MVLTLQLGCKMITIIILAKSAKEPIFLHYAMANNYVVQILPKFLHSEIPPLGTSCYTLFSPFGMHAPLAICALALIFSF